MTLKYFTDEPRVTDEIVFNISTPDQNGCNISDPYRLDNVKIYFVERSYLSSNHGQYDKVQYDEQLLKKTMMAERTACENPTDENIIIAQNIRNQLELSAVINKSYFNDAVIVHSVGTSTYPAWLSTDVDNAQVIKITEDSNGDIVYGQYEYTWRPEGSVRAGDYFICWTWTPQPAGDSIAAHEPFVLLGDPNVVVSIPTHLTPDDKYEILQDTYLPTMYKTYISDQDITPETLTNFNNAVAKGFKFMEDYAIQLIDLLDANVLHESMLPYLANLFNLKLRTSEPALWRRQIKSAIKLYKKKGTLDGLKEALAQANMELDKMTRLYQVISPYNWTESFFVKDSPTFDLKYIALNPNETNFFVYLRRDGTEEYEQVDIDNIEFTGTDCNFNSSITWVGDKKSSEPLYLYESDVLKITYNYNTIPSGQESVEAYIQGLPLADRRDEMEQEFPPKNWNVKFIEEDDPLLATVCPVIHPYKKDVIFGHIRSEFPYSENVYNSEEYNGSIKETTNPCFIDKEWIDDCSCCLSSCFNISVTIQDLSDERLLELRDILTEYSPFHAVPFRIYFSGNVIDFVKPPIETYQKLVSMNMSDYIISGGTNNLFTRFLGDGVTNYALVRGQLGDINTIVLGQTGTAFNTSVGLIVPLYDLSRLGINFNNHLFEVLGPSPNQGQYNIECIVGQSALINGSVIEPIDEAGFTCSLYNVSYTANNASITQDDVFTFTDENLIQYTIYSLDDVDNGYATSSSTINIPAYSGTPYEIQSFVNGQLKLLDPDQTLPVTTTNGITYSIETDVDTVISSTTGKLTVKRRGLVNLNNLNIDVNQFTKINHYVKYGQKYVISQLVGNEELYIDNYIGGDVAGVSLSVLQPIFESQIGYFSYYGLNLITPIDYEMSLQINDMDDPNLLDNNNFKENFLIGIDGYYYKIRQIDSVNIVLDGFPQNWTTINAGGTLVNFDIIQIEKVPVVIEGVQFDSIDRRGDELIKAEIETGSGTEVLALSTGTGFEDSISQQEKIKFEIEYLNGDKFLEELND